MQKTTKNLKKIKCVRLTNLSTYKPTQQGIELRVRKENTTVMQIKKKERI